MIELIALLIIAVGTSMILFLLWKITPYRIITKYTSVINLGKQLVLLREKMNTIHAENEVSFASNTVVISKFYFRLPYENLRFNIQDIVCIDHIETNIYKLIVKNDKEISFTIPISASMNSLEFTTLLNTLIYYTQIENYDKKPVLL